MLAFVVILQQSVLLFVGRRAAPSFAISASRLRPHERLLACHDDVYAVAQPERIVAVHRILGEELWQHSRIRINAGKTQIWNRGTKPSSTKLEPSILTQRSSLAVLIVLRKNVASEFWTLLLGTVDLSGRSWMPPRPFTSCCFSGSQQCWTCSQRGFFCCSVPHHGRHFIFLYVILTTLKHSHDSMTFTLGNIHPKIVSSKKTTCGTIK